MKVLIIDDDIVARKTINQYLVDKHNVETADDGDSGVALAQSSLPDVVLLDVEMPGKNGYEVCDLLRQSPATRDIPVLFLSGRGSLRERLQGYEAGGDDYLVKPCDPNELNAKVIRLGELHRSRKQLASKAREASLAAMEAMSTSYELGRTIRYVETTYDCTDSESLAAELLALLQDFDLHCTVMFCLQGSNKYYSHGQRETPPLEANLIQQLHNQKRFYDFGCRTLVSYPLVGLLVKNMPLDNRERYGRIKDVLPFVLSATNAKLQVLLTEHGLRRQAEQLGRSVEAVRHTLQSLSSAIADNQSSISKRIQQLTDQLETSLPAMGLEQDQEGFIIASIDRTFCDISSLIDRGDSLRASLTGIVRLLEQLATQQRQLLIDSAPEASPKQDAEQPEQDNDIELF
jgi:DNA-binding response OmpR family regulator